MILVLMGVSGSGKTRIGSALAAELGWPFIDADDLHPPANVAKMRAGEPLSDADREPWLEALAARLQRAGGDAVLACSALRHDFRARLAAAGDVRFVYLKIDPETARRRVSARVGHFMPPSLTESQFETLEEPQHATEIDATESVEDVLAAIRKSLF